MGALAEAGREYDEIDLSAPAFWALSETEREERFAHLRRDRPVSWHRPYESVLVPAEDATGGYWAVTRHEDVRAVSRAPAVFCSGQGVMFDDAPPELLEASQSFLAMDDPRHGELRGLVNAAFTPRRVRLIEDQIAANAARVVDELLERGDCDFVEHVAGRLPMLTLWDMIGMPEADRARCTEAAYDMVGWNDPEVVGDRDPPAMLFEGVLTITGAALELADARRREPADDLMTALVEAEVDGRRLADDEIGAFLVLLAVAGNDTTKHTTSHGLRALTEHPEQRAVLLEDLDEKMPAAVEEIIRWATPVMTFRRTATRAAEIGGVGVGAGEKVVLFYTAANRDEEAFEEPGRFDVRRSPNHHVGFGGGGPHYCLGASLARTQLRALFSELLRRAPRIEAGEPRPITGNFVNAIAAMPCAIGGAA